jgi:hypothetical protein
MTDAYFTKASLLAVWVRKCLPKCKRTSGSLETKPILKEALIYTGRISKYNSQKFQLPRYHLISRQGEKQVSSCRS